MCNIAKIYNKVLLLRIRSVLENHLLDLQNGFRPGRSTITHIVALRALLQHVLDNKNLKLLACFVHFSKAFDSVNWDYIRAILVAYQVPELLIRAIMSLYEGAQARVKVNGELSLLFELLRGILQGDTTAPYLFIIVADYILRRALALHPEVAFVLEGNTTGPRTRSRAQREQGYCLRETGGLNADDLFFMSGGDGRLDGYVQSLTELLKGLQRLAEEVELKFNTVGG
jgi:hypothetical protein